MKTVKTFPVELWIGISLFGSGLVSSCSESDNTQLDELDTGTDTDTGVIGDFEENSGAMGDNPSVQTIYTADPAPMVNGGRLYVYTSGQSH